jgi:hypothetical protein
VYDLQAACAWHLFDANIETLLDIVRQQIQDLQIPIVVPFHSVCPTSRCPSYSLLLSSLGVE